MKIYHSLNVNYHSFLGKTNSLVSPLKTAVIGFENLSAKDTAELLPEFKKKLLFLDQIKNDKENFWENLSIRYGYMTGFVGIVKEYLGYSLESIDTLMNANSSTYDKERAQEMLDASIRIVSCFSIKANEYYDDINYLTDGKFREMVDKHLQQNGSNTSSSNYSSFLFSIKDLNYKQWDNLEEMKQSFEKALAKVESNISALKDIWYKLKEYYTGESADTTSEVKKMGDTNSSVSKNSMKYTLLNIFLDYIEISKHIPNDSPLKKMMEKEQEALRNDLLKADILDLPESSSLLDYKV